LFNDENPTGIPYASFAGDTNIFIKGDGLVDGIQSNVVVLYSNDLKKELVAPALTENDAFGSNPNLGFLQYRLPSPSALLGVPKESLGAYSVMSFTLSIKHFNDLTQEYEYERCGNPSLCTISYKRSISPIMYTLSPPVVYFGS